jgi:hypothetical protein
VLGGVMLNAVAHPALAEQNQRNVGHNVDIIGAAERTHDRGSHVPILTAHLTLSLP